MKTSTKLFLSAASLVGLLSSTSGAALAQDAAAAPAPDWALTGYVAATSDYRFRGISQNERNFAPQGSLNVTGPDGFYVGTWASEVDFTPGSQNNPYVELDIYGGKHTDLWGVDWNFEPYYYAYPSENYPGVGTPQADYFEIQNQFSKSFGPLALSGTWAWSNNLAFNGGTGNALYGNATYTIFDWLSVSSNLGHQWAQAAKVSNSRDYTFGDFGLTASWKGFALDGRYSGTDLNTTQCQFYVSTSHACSGGFVATLTYNFNLLP
jgi:uncharacterized protein (TIGR02001 family)